MLAVLALALPLALPPVGNLTFAQTAPEAEPEDPSILPAGDGQEETFYACSACHSTAIIRRSAFTREQWDGLMDWMVEKQGMNPLEAADRRQIVDYLAQHFGPRASPRGRNPFLN
ncbi:cytochrome C-552 [Roseococcus sp. XZZS9]|uniref:Cytochrome C-552 n=1 Tax=Roseococcus pinisoli TaxID=2835040 RepID=A0ABS5QGG0_9PROT|nr:cytochrome C-552 [Roseococcus pinisoli]